MPRTLPDTMWTLRDVGLTALQTATILGVPKRQIYRWEAGESTPDHDLRERIETLGRIIDQLREVYHDDDQVIAWLLRPNDHLADKVPYRQLEAQRFDAVLRVARKAQALPVRDGVRT